MIEPLIVAQQAPNPLFAFLMQMALIGLVFYFVWFVPMRKKQQALESLLDSLKKGDKVVTNSGFYGEVVKTHDQTVVLKLAENVKVRVAKRAIAGLEGSQDDSQAN